MKAKRGVKGKNGLSPTLRPKKIQGCCAFSKIWFRFLRESDMLANGRPFGERVGPVLTHSLGLIQGLVRTLQELPRIK